MIHNASRQLRLQVLSMLLALLAAAAAHAQTITLVSSDWSLSADTADLAFPGAGMDFAASYRQWATSDALITINTGNASRWYVTAHLRVPAGQSWPAALSVYVIRTGDGTGLGSPPNGALNTPIGPLPTEPLGATPATPFFDSRRQLNNVPVTLRIDGLTATLPAGTYQIEVVYTVQ